VRVAKGPPFTPHTPPSDLQKSEKGEAGGDAQCVTSCREGVTRWWLVSASGLVPSFPGRGRELS